MQYNGYQTNYNQLYPYQPMNQPMMNQPVMNNTQQIQNGGYVEVGSFQEVIDYPVANATSVNFIDMKAMKVYVKTRGFSSFDQPIIESFSLVKDEQKEKTSPEFAKVSEEVQALKSEIENMKTRLAELGGNSNE